MACGKSLQFKLAKSSAQSDEPLSGLGKLKRVTIISKS